VIGLLAAASIGATWAQCAPDLSAPAVLDRFAQLRPRVLIAATTARHRGRAVDRCDAVEEIRRGLPDLAATILVDVEADGAVETPGTATSTSTHTWDDLVRADEELTFTALPFDHPLWVLFSSGTTGTPKGILHSHGGTVVSLLPALSLHLDIRPDDRMFWYSSTNWVMWNVSVSALMTGATVIVYDGSPLHPDATRLWRIAADERATLLGTSPGHLRASEREGLRPGAQFDLSSLRVLGSTGSPLPAAGYRWVHEAVGPRVQLSSITGGTDAIVAFAGTSPATPVWPGEISARALGVAMESWGPDREARIDDVGELVLTRPLPSMPITLWNDPDGSRLRAAYFEDIPGVWRHGDWVTVTSRGTVLMHGRSDATLNRNGVRLGSAEIYAAIDGLPQIEDSVVIGIEQEDGGYWMPLFVKLAPGIDQSDALEDLVRDTIRRRASPRHVPDEVIPVSAVPRTRTGKRVEVPLKRILQGEDPDAALSSHALEDPQALAPFISLARGRA
jgi:acetoacetyl-CoA synthetase